MANPDYKNYSLLCSQTITLATATPADIVLAGPIGSVVGGTSIIGDTGTITPTPVTINVLPSDYPAAALDNAMAAFAMYSAYTPTTEIGPTVTTSLTLPALAGGEAYFAPGDLTITNGSASPIIITLTGTATDRFTFQIGATTGGSLTTNPTLGGISFGLVGGVLAENIIWLVNGTVNLNTVGSNVTNFLGTIITVGNNAVSTNGNILLGTGSSSNGLIAPFSNSGIPTNITTNGGNSTITATGGDPHCICIDGSRIDLYEPGFYRLFGEYVSPSRYVIINAEVRRTEDYTDYYHMFWIKVRDECEECGECEYLLEFVGDNVRVVDLLCPEVSVLETVWEKTYVCRDPESGYKKVYKFICEAKHRNVAMELSGMSDNVVCGGLLAGQIVPLSGIYDQRSVIGCVVAPNYYEYSGLVCGSVYPKVVTVQGNRLDVRDNCYRLAQWSGEYSIGIVNMCVDDVWRVRELFLCVEDLVGDREMVECWRWEGVDHWDLKCLHYDVELGKRKVCDKVFCVGVDSFVLLRVQANGSVSMAVRGIVECGLYGLMFGDVVSLEGVADLSMFFGGDVSLGVERVEVREDATVYERVVERCIGAV